VAEEKADVQFRRPFRAEGLFIFSIKAKNSGMGVLAREIRQARLPALHIQQLQTYALRA